MLAVITAKAKSVRLPGKNLLPLGGKPLVWWSIRAAREAGLPVVVCTDSPAVAELASGCEVVDHPTGSHRKAIEHAMRGRDEPCVLLQPSSPFRCGGIVQACLRAYDGRAVFTRNTVHDVRIVGECVVQSSEHLSFWDGCVAIFPPGKVCQWYPAKTVRNLPINSLQIDTQEDYVAACAMWEHQRPSQPAIPDFVASMVKAYVLEKGAWSDRVSVVGRPGRIAADSAVWHVNHCRGYVDRCDGVFVIAGPNLVKVGINQELRECAARAKVVLVRDHGSLDWLINNLPEMRGKFLPIGCSTAEDARLTSGCMLVDMFSRLGCRVELVGKVPPGLIQERLLPFHFPSMSREIGLLHRAGVYDDLSVGQ